MNLRQKSIIKELIIKNRTTAYLAKLLEVTARTVRNDINDINEYLKKYDANIIRDKNNSLRLSVGDENKFEEFIKENLDFSELNFTEPENRIIFIALKFLFADNYIKLDDFLDQIHVSKSTLQNDFKDVKEILSEHNLSFESKPNYGLKILGSETDIRNAISNILYNTDPNRLNKEARKNILLFDEDKLERIYEIVLGNISESNIDLSDMALNNLVVHIAIAIRRIEINQYINKEFKNDLIDKYEYQIAKEIVKDIEDEFEIKFPNEEIYYITMHLLGIKLVIKDAKVVKESSEDVKIKELAKKMIKFVEEQLGYRISDDQELLYAITLHLKPAIHRYRNNMNIRNPLLASIKHNYPIIYQTTISATKIIKDELDISFNEDEIGYLAIHLGAAVERAKLETKPIRTLVVCTTGVGSSQLLKYKLEARFPNQLEVIEATELYNLRNVKSGQYDLIISTVPLGDYDEIPYIVVDDILGDSNFSEIGSFINKDEIRNKEYLDIDDIYLNLNFETKERIIEFLCDQIYKKNKAPKELYDLIMERENIVSTSFGNLVAIPHPVKLITKDTFWTVGILDKPIKWGKKDVQLVILLNVAAGAPESLKDMYKLLLGVVDNSSLVNKIINSKTKQEVYNLMNNQI